jgi:hypothetical protein
MLKNFACGVWPLIEDGIRRYVDEHGRKPVALVLHPEQVKELPEPAASGSPLLADVSVIPSSLIDLPMLMNESGKFFPL